MRIGIYVIFTFISIVSINSQPISLKQNINWLEFMSRQDIVWEKLPEYWHESAYLGNGKLGLMIYKEPEKITYVWKPVIVMYMPPCPKRCIRNSTATHWTFCPTSQRRNYQ